MWLDNPEAQIIAGASLTKQRAWTVYGLRVKRRKLANMWTNVAVWVGRAKSKTSVMV